MTDRIKVRIEPVTITTETLGTFGGTAAICHDEGDHYGVHWVVPGTDDAAMQWVLALCDDPYVYEVDDARTNQPATYRCPDGERHPGDVVGCGAVFAAEPDDEGVVDCPTCGMFFAATGS
jgi:hypothetical protein